MLPGWNPGRFGQSEELGNRIQCPVRAGPPGLDRDLVAGLDDRHGRRAVRVPRGPPGTTGSEPDGAVAGSSAERCQGPAEVEWAGDRVATSGHCNDPDTPRISSLIHRISS